MNLHGTTDTSGTGRPLAETPYALPMSFVIEAQKLAVSIDDTCINALKQKIQEQKALLYIESFLKQPKPVQQ